MDTDLDELKRRAKHCGLHTMDMVPGDVLELIAEIERLQAEFVALAAEIPNIASKATEKAIDASQPRILKMMADAVMVATDRQNACIAALDVENAELKAKLRELVEAIDRRWAGETDRKRANAISPRMENAIAAARATQEKP